MSMTHTISRKRLSIALPRIDRKLGWGKSSKSVRVPARMHDRVRRGAQTEASLLATAADAKSIRPYILSKSGGTEDLPWPTQFVMAIMQGGYGASPFATTTELIVELALLTSACHWTISQITVPLSLYTRSMQQGVCKDRQLVICTSEHSLDILPFNDSGKKLAGS